MDNNLKKLMYVFFGILPIIIILMFIMKAYSLTNMTEEDSQKVIELIESVEFHKETSMEELHDEICNKVPESPVCRNIELLRRINIIGQSKGVPARLLIGIAYAESHIGVNFNREACRGYNNWFGLKGKKYDNGRVEWFTKNKKADTNGCWLYYFDSIEDGFYSLANTISKGYKGCNNNVTCLAYGYVGNPKVAEPSWIKHVSMWY